MGRTHTRLAVWALALTGLIIAGDRTVYAADNTPRVEGGGEIPLPDVMNTVNGTDKVHIGVTGKFEKNTNPPVPQGHFQYHNEFSGLKADGKILTLTFETLPTVTFDPITGNAVCTSSTTPTPDPDGCSCVASAQPQADLSGKPAATITGQCDRDDGNPCSFKVMVVDATDGGPKGPDWVCNLHVSGMSPKMPLDNHDDNQALPLIHGHIEIKNVP